MSLISKITNWFMRVSSWTKALIAFVASQIIYFIMILITIPAIEARGNGLRIFDLMPFGYSQQYAIDLLEGLGEQGRNIYLTNQIPLDLLYPGLMGVTGALFIALLVKKINPSLKILIFLPIIAAVFDYLENFMVAIMLFSFPDVPSVIITFSSVSTILKSMLTSAYLFLLVLLFVIFFYRAIRLNRKKSNKMKSYDN